MAAPQGLLCFTMTQHFSSSSLAHREAVSISSKLLNEILFDIPEKIGPNAKIVITKKMVQDKLDSITQNKDLSEYIL